MFVTIDIKTDREHLANTAYLNWPTPLANSPPEPAPQSPISVSGADSAAINLAVPGKSPAAGICVRKNLAVFSIDIPQNPQAREQLVTLAKKFRWRVCRKSLSPLQSVRYHSNFSPSWICRDVVAVEVITPAVGDGPPVAAA